MKFNCYKKDVVEALPFVIRAVAVKPQTPILSGIYLRAEGSVLELQANNFATGIITGIPVNVEASGEIVVSGKRFQEFVKNMPGDTISFSDEGNSLRIESGGASVELLTMNAEDFPKVKTPDTDNSFTIRAAALRDLIRKTAFSTMKLDTSRPIFNGVNFELDNGFVTLVATNTHRLASATDMLIDGKDKANFVVPDETLNGILSRISPKDVDSLVTVKFSGRYVTFEFENVFISSRLIEGQFPPYDKVIPKSADTRVTVDTADFKKAVEFVSLMSKETEFNTVKFVFADGGIEISANSSEVGGAVKNVEAELEGADLEIAFNVEYILDVLRVVDTKQVNIKLNGRFDPAAFYEVGNNDYVYVATPVRAA